MMHELQTGQRGCGEGDASAPTLHRWLRLFGQRGLLETCWGNWILRLDDM